MPDLVRSVAANAAGNATLSIGEVPTGIEWIVAQVSVETLPARNTATFTMRKNGRYITSSAFGSGASAQGPPYLRLTSHDTLTCAWTGMSLNDSCIVTLYYSENLAGQIGRIEVV